jgi:hypothetical protein
MAAAQSAFSGLSAYSAKFNQLGFQKIPLKTQRKKLPSPK